MKQQTKHESTTQKLVIIQNLDHELKEFALHQESNIRKNTSFVNILIFASLLFVFVTEFGFMESNIIKVDTDTVWNVCHMFTYLNCG